MVRELTRQEKKRAQEGLMLITRKKSGEVKSRLAYNGKPTRGWIKDEEKALPTVLTESLFITCAIDSHEGRSIMIMDIPNAFIQAGIPKREKGDQIIMKIRGKLVDWLVEILPETYRNKVVIENEVKVLYLKSVRAIYGMLEAALMWYRRLRTDLEKEEYIFHEYDPCIVTKVINGRQHLVRFHVDDILSSLVDPKVNDHFARWAQKMYGKIKPVEVKRGKIFRFLGMTLDLSKEGECHALQEDQIAEIVSNWPEEIEETKKELTPCTSSLFEKGEGGLLCDRRRELFHTIVAKYLFIGNRSRPDILPPVNVLASRVREPNEVD